jgi:hypothetical protein
MDRRDLLQILAASPFAARFASGQHGHEAAPLDLQNYKPRVLKPDEYAFLIAFCDVLIPADTESGGAVQAGVPYFVDTILFHSDEPIRRRWQNGFEKTRAFVSERFGADLAALSERPREQAIEELLRNEVSPVSEQDHFIKRLKQSIIDGYFVSQVGFDHLHYTGNKAIGEFAGCTHPEHQP